jgi:hypothetical protein
MSNELKVVRRVMRTIELDEDLDQLLQGFLDTNPEWDQDRAFAAALGMFLMQNSNADGPDASTRYRRAARIYLTSLFRHAV